MLGSMFIGLSGMTAYSAGLRQVSNNITNLNSSGFRATRLGFNDLFSGTSQGFSYLESGPQGGDGVSLSDLRLDLTQGELRQSDRDLDLAIEGNGFLVLEREDEIAYARTGSFEVDSEGYVVLSGTDYKLTVLDDQGRPQALTIDSYRTNAPSPSTRIEFSDNLSSTATEHVIPDVRIYNETGAESVWQIRFERDAENAGMWTVTVTDQEDKEIGSQTLNFISGIIDPETKRLTYEDVDNGLSIELDFSEGVTSFSSGQISTLRAEHVNGYSTGEITTLGVNRDGDLEIAYSNEQIENLGAITLADFREPQNLQQQTGGLFTYNRSERPEYSGSESERVGRVLSRRIESSNVDLSKEFGDLIIVQRGYQASSQIVSVTNDMIQQLFGISGRG